MLFLKSVIVSSNNINVWSCNSVFQFWHVMHYLSEMTEEQTLVMCSGHPQGLFPSSPSAPRAIISNGMVIHISSASVFDTLKKRRYCVISWVCYLVLFLVIKPAKQKILWKNTKHIFFIVISSDWPLFEEWGKFIHMLWLLWLRTLSWKTLFLLLNCFSWSGSIQVTPVHLLLPFVDSTYRK